MKRSKHNLSHYHLTSCDMGELIPVGCVEVLPGDTFRHRTSALIRVTPQLKPLMHPVQARIHHFFVPTRLIWTGWEAFITDQSGASSPPTISGGAHSEGTLSDYLGVYNDASNAFSALPIRHTTRSTTITTGIKTLYPKYRRIRTPFRRSRGRRIALLPRVPLRNKGQRSRCP